MVLELLKLRLIQAQRILKSVGLLYTVLIFFTYLIIILKLFKSTQPESHQTAAILLIVSILSLHYSRPDKRFIYTTFHEKATLVFTWEYNIIAFLFSFPLLFGPNNYLFLIVHFAISIISLIEFKPLNISFSSTYLIFPFIPKQFFEWRAGMRKNQFLILLLYFLAIGLGIKFYASFVILGLITFIISSFYNEAEPLNILLLNQTNAKDFIRKKLLSHLKYYLIFISPILLLYFFKYPDYLIFYVPLLIIYILNFLVFILNKYKSFVPNKLNNSNTVIVSMMFAGMFLPFLFPLSIILVFVYYRKSISNLNAYFNAENQ
jgi:hypothetical protein